MPARPVRRAALAGGVAALALGGLVAPAPASAVDLGRYLVTLDPSTTDPGLVAAAQVGPLGGAVDRVFSHALRGYSASLPAASVAALRLDPRVLAVEPDRLVPLSATQADPPSYGIDRVDQRALPLSRSYTYTATGAGVRAYVIDTGINAAHPDFTGRIGQGRDVNDGDAVPEDCNGHGSHVAGTVAGTRFGVAKAATIVPVKVFGCGSSTATSTIIAGVDWTVADHQAGQPAVANLSLGGGASTAMDAAIKGLVADGVAVAVAAGNETADACGVSPARVPEVLTVAATDSADRMASYSNGGACVDLFAPGSSIVSAAATGAGSATLSGTSMASPHVAGVLAQQLERTPSATPAQASAAVVGAATSGVVTGTARSCTLVVTLCRPATAANKLLFTS